MNEVIDQKPTAWGQQAITDEKVENKPALNSTEGFLFSFIILKKFFLNFFFATL